MVIAHDSTDGAEGWRGRYTSVCIFFFFSQRFCHVPDAAAAKPEAILKDVLVGMVNDRKHAHGAAAVDQTAAVASR